ncbi:NAD-dependent epimerase/dehydratase family protein [Aurantiacibacter gangjinensis]|uniref:Uncharacterized protein n=1 Tax=Aurantiacibacter gangjinensis TaxID=502682 RepID=A0A0G9MMD5_9SPHN|nr:NAD-dependent epimerase/dehydratase family protein [Aurantiacibacter gangjinensis]APE27951.1 Nucleoside-diphosphate-sugar epimerase [Aurantiacibacter gangjinensis]KLE31896.1 hypothetical protein AAW01_10610 [Aurantiacibacter gangjinensis]
MSKRTILITGATGGLGKALVREALARGHGVRATGRKCTIGDELAAMGAEFRWCDLADPAADVFDLVQGCDSVIHAAGLSASWGPREQFERVNVDGTRVIVEAARAAGCSRFVVISSPSIFASLRDRTKITADAAPGDPPLNHYASTKLAAERLVLAAADENFATVAIRPRALVGDGDQVILPRLAEIAARKRVPLPRHGKAMIELTDLRDAAWACLEAEERAPATSPVAINISGGKPIAVGELARKAADALGLSPKFANLPLPLAHGVARLLEYGARALRLQKEPPLTRYTLSTLGYSQTFDLAPAKMLLGYEPRYDAVATLLEQAAAMRNSA